MKQEDLTDDQVAELRRLAEDADPRLSPIDLAYIHPRVAATVLALLSDRDQWRRRRDPRPSGGGRGAALDG